MRFILLILLLFTISFAQYQTDAVVFGNNGNLNFYDFQTGISHQNLVEIGPTPNQLVQFNGQIVVVNSGDFGAGTNLQIIPAEALAIFKSNQDTIQLRNAVQILPLSANGNAWQAAGINDSLLVVTLAATSELQVININSHTIIQTISGLTGNPQGICAIDANRFAVSLADWGAGTGNQIAVFNSHNFQIEKTIPVHLNAVNVQKLKNGNLVSFSWGAWSGPLNYGTLELISKDSLAVLHQENLPDMKLNYVVEMNDSTLFLNGYDAGYAPKNALFNLNSKQLTIISAGFFIDHRYYCNLFDGSYLVGNSGSAGSAVYSAQLTWLQDINTDFSPLCSPVNYPGTSGIFEDDSQLPAEITLSPNYPNPFNPETTIQFSIAKSGFTKLSIYNQLGQLISTLFSENLPAGTHHVKFNAAHLPSGIYYCQLSSGSQQLTRRMNLLK